MPGVASKPSIVPDEVQSLLAISGVSVLVPKGNRHRQRLHTLAVFVGFTAKLTSMPVKAAVTKCYCRRAASMHLLRSCGTRCKAFLHTGARHRLILTTDHG